MQDEMAEQEPVYLCQVREGLSCGACCGLYNVADPSREYLSSELARRTEEFAGLPRTENAIDAFSRETLERRNIYRRPYKEFYHCPFLGLVGEGRDRPGCLLHPLAAGNDGKDLRGLSWYGAMACRTYFCPSHGGLSPRYALAVRESCDDWHLYGLAVTETAMLECFFAQVEKRLPALVAPERFREDLRAREALLKFLRLKVSWPHRLPGENRLANYFFNDGLYPRPKVPYALLGTQPSDLDPVLSALCSFFPDRESLEDGLDMISAAVCELAAALA
ncbi:MAG: hypothetical protein AB1921_00045 [Thermodesulfobacteriota bacterium]